MALQHSIGLNINDFMIIEFDRNDKRIMVSHSKVWEQNVAEEKEAAKKEAAAKTKDLANEMSKATNMEAQKAVQAVVVQAMAYKPGFDVYNKQLIIQSVFYKPVGVYGGQVNVDNRRLSRGLSGASDRLHEEMVNEQYRR